MRLGCGSSSCKNGSTMTHSSDGWQIRRLDGRLTTCCVRFVWFLRRSLKLEAIDQVFTM